MYLTLFFSEDIEQEKILFSKHIIFSQVVRSFLLSGRAERVLHIKGCIAVLWCTVRCLRGGSGGAGWRLLHSAHTSRSQRSSSRHLVAGATHPQPAHAAVGPPSVSVSAHSVIIGKPSDCYEFK
jgi:hypothetical protein